MRRGSGSRTDQGEVLDDCCHVTSASGTLRSEGHVITLKLFIKINIKSNILNLIKKKLFKFNLIKSL